MPVRLSPRDQEMLDGSHGPAPQLAMSILVRMAEVYGAAELMDISGAHIDSTIYLGDATLEFAERLASLGARVAVPTSLNVSGVDECGWTRWSVPEEWARKAARQMQAYETMGAVPTWTCAPYQTQMRPRFGQQIAWGESNAISFANSVIGARTQRYPDLLDICCAITGRVPAVGLHLEENRGGDVLCRLVDVPAELQADDQFMAVLGHLVGQIAGDDIPVIDGLVVLPNDDQLKAFAAAAASSGRVALFHMVGITPEAPSRNEALHGRPPKREVPITRAALRAARAELTTADGRDLDMVILGSPHFSPAEFARLAPLVGGRQKHPRVRFLITSGRPLREDAERAGTLQPVLEFGAEITLDTCILASPMLPPDIRTLMTNSAKYAYYAPSLLDRQVTFGSLEDCVRSAIEGRVVRDETRWND